MPTIKVCKELYLELKKIRDGKISRLKELGFTGVFDGWSYPSISWENCSREWFNQVSKSKRSQ